jgi:hypothetical protein
MLLALVSIFTPFVLIGWFYLVLLSSLVLLFRPKVPASVYISLIVYVIAFEIIARMAGASPFIPYEMGKYLLFLLLVGGILKYRTSALPAFWMVILLIPGLLVQKSAEVSFLDIIFNFMGPLNAALAILFFKGKTVSKTMLLHYLRLMIYPMVSVFFFAIFRTPDIEEAEFSLSANSAASGGFGSNQVSTGLGLAAFFVFVFWINRWRLTGSRTLDASMLLFFTIQGLLTFSRGGMMTGFLGVVVVLFYLRKATTSQIKKYNLVRIGKYLIPAFLLILGSFFLVNRLTNGLLFLRYQGETAGTFAGTKEKDLNIITSGRLDIFLGDLELWADHPITGVGVAASRYMRERMTGVVAHVELSRLLAEHGIFGLAYFVILVFYGFKAMRSSPNPAISGLLFALFAVGLFTSFHAAMRTFVSPLMIGLSMLTVTEDKPKRKSPISADENHQPLTLAEIKK